MRISWSGYSRRSWYYRPTKVKPKVNKHLAARSKRVIDQLPYASYRTVAWLLDENKNTIQRLFQLKGWQVRKRKSGARPKVQALPSVASRPNERGAHGSCLVRPTESLVRTNHCDGLSYA